MAHSHIVASFQDANTQTAPSPHCVPSSLVRGYWDFVPPARKGEMRGQTKFTGSRFASVGLPHCDSPTTTPTANSNKPTQITGDGTGQRSLIIFVCMESSSRFNNISPFHLARINLRAGFGGDSGVLFLVAPVREIQLRNKARPLRSDSLVTCAQRVQSSRQLRVGDNPCGVLDQVCRPLEGRVGIIPLRNIPLWAKMRAHSSATSQRPCLLLTYKER